MRTLCLWVLPAASLGGCCLEVVNGRSGEATTSGSNTTGTIGPECNIAGRSYANRSLDPQDLTKCCNARTSPNAWLPLFTQGAYLPEAASGNDEVAGDFDGDGRDDLAIGDGNDDIEVFFSQPDGTWSTPAIIPIGIQFLRPAVGDMNHDGRLDIVVASGELNIGNSLFVLLNEGNRQFSSPLGFAAPSDCRIDPVRVGDLDGDGWPDVVVGLSRVGATVPCPEGQVGIFLNLARGDGNLASPSFLTAFGSGFSGDVRLGDFNGDGLLDAVASDYQNTVAFYLNAGQGRFGAPILNTSLTPNPFAPYDLLSAPFSGLSDGVAVSSGTSPTIAFVGIGGQPLTSESATYSVHATYGLPTPIASVIDVNGDGRPDALFANGGTLDLLINQPDGTFALASPSIMVDGLGAQMITVGDFNGDDAPDLAVLYDDYQHWGTWLNSCPP
jgi:hypothetical protein